MMPARQLRTFLESLRGPVAAMVGLSVDNVIVYAQQDLGQHIRKAVSSGSCAILLGIKDFSSKAEARVPGPPVDVSMEVSIWTPEVLTGPDSPATLDVAEAITFGLHGRKPPEGAAGLALIPKFIHAELSTETLRGGTSQYLVATLTFQFPAFLRAVSTAD